MSNVEEDEGLGNVDVTGWDIPGEPGNLVPTKFLYLKLNVWWRSRVSHEMYKREEAKQESCCHKSFPMNGIKLLGIYRQRKIFPVKVFRSMEKKTFEKKF